EAICPAQAITHRSGPAAQRRYAARYALRRPVDCFYEGENMLIIHPDECIDCGVCEPECPVDAIKPDTEPGLEKWLVLNAEYGGVGRNITVKREPPPNAKEWEDKPDKANLLSPNPGAGD